MCGNLPQAESYDVDTPLWANKISQPTKASCDIGRGHCPLVAAVGLEPTTLRV